MLSGEKVLITGTSGGIETRMFIAQWTKTRSPLARGSDRFGQLDEVQDLVHVASPGGSEL